MKAWRTYYLIYVGQVAHDSDVPDNFTSQKDCGKQEHMCMHVLVSHKLILISHHLHME